MVSQLRIEPMTRPLVGSVPLPDDEDVLLARLAVSALSRGQSTFTLREAPYGAPRVFLDALSLLSVGVKLKPRGSPSSTTCELVVQGVGLLGTLAEPGPLDVRGEPRAAALLVGLLAGRPTRSELFVDSVVAELLGSALAETHGILVETQSEGARLVLQPSQQERPPGLSIESMGLFPWVKQAALLLGLRARSETVVTEKIASSDHMERVLLRSKMPVSVHGTSTELHPPRDADAVSPTQYEALGSVEAAAYLMAAGLMVSGSRIGLRDCCLNPGRADYLALLRLCGADVALTPQGDRQGEPIGEVTVSGRLGGGSFDAPRVLGGENMARCADAALPLGVALAAGTGDTLMTDLVTHQRGGDRRIYGRFVGLLRSAGAVAETSEGGVLVRGRGASGRFRALRVTTGGDGRLALLGTLMALAGDGTSFIDDADCLRERFPRWVGTLRALGAEISVQQAP